MEFKGEQTSATSHTKKYHTLLLPELLSIYKINEMSNRSKKRKKTHSIRLNRLLDRRRNTSA